MKRTINIIATFDITNDGAVLDEIVDELKKEFEATYDGIEAYKGLKVEVIYE